MAQPIKYHILICISLGVHFSVYHVLSHTIFIPKGCVCGSYLRQVKRSKGISTFRQMEEYWLVEFMLACVFDWSTIGRELTWKMK